MFRFRFIFYSAPLMLWGLLSLTLNDAYAGVASVVAGQEVSLSIIAEGTSPFAYQWYRDSIPLNGATSATYDIVGFQASNAGTYTAVLSNSSGATTSDMGTLVLIAAPVITTQPVSQTVVTGASVSFNVAASGAPAPTYQWRKNGNALTGETGASFTIASTGAGDTGTYTVVATNSVNSVTSNGAVLTVNAAPVFTSQPVNQTVIAGASVSFSVTASGTPAPTYQWRKNGSSLAGATGASFTIASTVAGDAGTYTVVATNSVNSATSNGAVLTVNAAPVFISQPVSQTVIAGASVTFSVAASGAPTPTYQWHKNGTALAGATGASFTIASTVAGDAGTYTALASNSVGNVTSAAATLTITANDALAPAITIQPISQTVKAGDQVIFTVSASGYPGPTIQWRRNGVDISGATNTSFPISSATAADTGNYAVLATNIAGTALSESASLSVIMPPSNATTSITVE